MIPESHKQVLKQFRIPQRCYLGWDKALDEIYTSQGTLVYSQADKRWKREEPDRGSVTGRNETGHRLPSSSTD